MKKLKYGSLLILLSICLCHVTFSQENEQPKPQKTFQQMIDQCQREMKSFNEAVKTGDRRLIRLRLKDQCTSMSSTAAFTLGQLGDEAFIPDLIKMYNESQARMNAEGTPQAERAPWLGAAIVSALEKITGLYLAPENATQLETQSAIETSQKWWDARHGQDEKPVPSPFDRMEIITGPSRPPQKVNRFF